MKCKFSADGIPIPWFAPLERRADLDRVVAEEGFALVIKPVDSRGSRGVLKLGETGELDGAYAAARENPEVLDQVYCYCNCSEPPFYHKSLLSCFTGNHGAG